jgi:hypothetical protein
MRPPYQQITGCSGICLSIPNCAGGWWFQTSLGKKFSRSRLNGKKLNVVVCAFYPSESGKVRIEGWLCRLAWEKSETQSPK